MAEITPQERANLVEALAPEFCARHNMNISGIPGPAELESLAKQNDCDLAFVPDDGAVVRFEHTRAPIADHARDVQDGRKARWDHARQMMTQLFDRLGDLKLP